MNSPPLVSDGSPLTADYLNYHWDHTRELLAAAGVSPSNSADSALRSDVLTATRRIIDRAAQQVADVGRFDLTACAPINRLGAHRSVAIPGDASQSSNQSVGSIAMSEDGRIVYALRGQALVAQFELAAPGFVDSLPESPSSQDHWMDSRFPTTATATSITFGSGGQLAVLCFRDGRFVTHRLPTPWQLRSRRVEELRVTRHPQVDGDSGVIVDLSWRSDGRVALATTEQTVLTLALSVAWDLSTASITSQFTPKLPTPYLSIAASPDGRRYCLSAGKRDPGSPRSVEQFWLSTPWQVSSSTRRTSLIVNFDAPNDVQGIAWRPDGGALLVALGIEQALQLDTVAVMA